ncbi:MAG: non-ribosomal peptide synthetase [Deltaproteobacteria bacterium]|nr:non-ribosomal peptide synthetase [Deltaproteobacteria bacterium]
MGILTRELWTLYEAFSHGKPSPFEHLPVQYSDYAVWQRNWLQGEVLDTQLDYWKKQLENLSILTLPTDRPRTPRQSFLGARVSVALPQALTASLNELSNRNAVTPFMTLLAAFQLLLHRYTGQEDIVIGSPVANCAPICLEIRRFANCYHGSKIPAWPLTRIRTCHSKS